MAANKAMGKKNRVLTFFWQMYETAWSIGATVNLSPLDHAFPFDNWGRKSDDQTNRSWNFSQGWPQQHGWLLWFVSWCYRFHGLEAIVKRRTKKNIFSLSLALWSVDISWHRPPPTARQMPQAALQLCLWTCRTVGSLALGSLLMSGMVKTRFLTGGQI